MIDLTPIAKAICCPEGCVSGKPVGPDIRCMAGQTAIMAKARAAFLATLDVLEEPTEATREAALAADLDIYWGYLADGRPGGPGDVWRVMLTAARREMEES